MTENPSLNNTTVLTDADKRQADFDSLANGGIKTGVRPRASFGRAAEKPANPAGYEDQSVGNKFLVNLMLMLIQLINPDNKSNGNLMGFISKAFGMEDDSEHTLFRQLKARTATSEGREQFRKNNDYTNFDAGAAKQAMRQGADLLSKNGPQNPDERQTRVMSVMDDAAKSAGISSKLMIGVWGYESTWGTKLKSPTGCLGDFQFSRATMVEVMSKDGPKIAERLRANGKAEQAEMVEAVHLQTKGMSGQQMKNFGSNNKAAVDALRMDPEISTYAAAHHLKSVSKQLRVDPNRTENFGLVYAGYNIGVGHALTIKNGGRASGWEVDANAGVANRGNQAASYQNAMMSRINGATGQVVAEKIATAGKPETTTAAFSAASTGAPKPPATTTPIVVADNNKPSQDELMAAYKPRTPAAAMTPS